MIIGDTIYPDPVPDGDGGSSEPGDWKMWVKAFIVVILLLWVVVTLIFWFMESPEHSLIDVLKNQWNWVRHLRIW